MCNKILIVITQVVFALGKPYKNILVSTNVDIGAFFEDFPWNDCCLKSRPVDPNVSPWHMLKLLSMAK